MLFCQSGKVSCRLHWLVFSEIYSDARCLTAAEQLRCSWSMVNYTESSRHQFTLKMLMLFKFTLNLPVYNRLIVSRGRKSATACVTSVSAPGPGGGWMIVAARYSSILYGFFCFMRLQMFSASKTSGLQAGQFSTWTPQVRCWFH